MPAAAHAVLPDRRAHDRPLRTGMRFDPLMPIDRWKAIGAALIVAGLVIATWLAGDVAPVTQPAEE